MRKHQQTREVRASQKKIYGDSTTHDNFAQGRQSQIQVRREKERIRRALQRFITRKNTSNNIAFPPGRGKLSWPKGSEKEDRIAKEHSKSACSRSQIHIFPGT